MPVISLREYFGVSMAQDNAIEFRCGSQRDPRDVLASMSTYQTQMTLYLDVDNTREVLQTQKLEADTIVQRATI